MNQTIANSRTLVLGASIAIGVALAAAGSMSAHSDTAMLDEQQVFGAPGDQHLVNDGALDTIRGRFVPEQGIDADGVILWDERPGRGAGGGGDDSSHRAANGLNNRQSANVTTQRDW
ncbi:hypothetical protein [Halomonas sp. DN3]|uniref:hypothetical protein n=1 Tax=Halomonas sp. DN3 TaxID=2953657 RepID=UPI00209FAF2F|nr:hypothetical protein [Halomonas sp. DN3]USZ50724.1 hypothetical protein NKF27_04255 [Halomonas sp. DN3]